MTPEEYKEVIQLVIVVGFSRKLTKAERRRLANLTGYFMQERQGPAPKDKRHLPRITEADFRTREAYKQLAEKILQRPIAASPCWSEGWRKGQFRCQEVRERKEKRATTFIEADLHDSIMKIYYDLADEILADREDARTDCDAQRSAINIVARDIKDVRVQVLDNGWLRPHVMSDIATGMANLLKKHTPKK
ncbi:hypothetical protein [Geobacter sp. 60473]|uniref:hypothetical protein n=1 Tax=Geobacter sp. 60473 TaxID=3080755 RepID=UPI002B2C006E|nr:hypothetical protein GEO60473_09580 [Geobacter sp. 60473]